jgi:hypothetical protein
MKKHLFHKTIAALTIGLALVSLTLPSKPAGAYSWLTCDDGDDKILWEADEGAACDGCATMRISTTSMPPGSIWDSELQSAMASWNDVERSRATFFVARDNNGSHATNNGDNEVYFDDIDGPGGTLAVTRLMFNGGWGDCPWLDDSNISEADVEFDVDESWYTGAFSYTTSSIHFRLVAVHEFGHALGMMHEDTRMARMNSFYPNGGPITRDKLVRAIADDRAGIRYLYSEGGTARADLVASNYKRTGSGRSAKVTGPTSASRGANVTFEYTFMNIGSANSGNFNIGFYLSSNDLITTGDRLLGTNVNASCSAGGLVTFTRTLTIPNSVTPGVYYVGILLDKDSAVTEWSDGNNGLAHWRTITIN